MSGAEAESALVARARAGDFQAFEDLLAPHERRLYGLARHLVGPGDAADVLQTALLGAVESLPGFRGESAFGTWLTRIVTNAGLKHLRKRRAHPTVSLDGQGDGDGGEIPRPELVADWREDPVREVERGELRAILDEAIARLPEHHRVVFALRDVAGLSVDETARTLEITPANVKVRLLRARLALRERLTRKFGDLSRKLELPVHDHDHVLGPARTEDTP